MDLRASLKWGANLELTAEQRKSLTDLCSKIAGKHFIPAYRLAESQALKKEAVARAEAAEKRIVELEAIMRYERDEWVALRPKNVTHASRNG